jgi:hypothetical protein
MPESTGFKVHIRAFGTFTEKVVKTIDQVNKLLSVTYQKRGGTFIYCTWSKRTGPHAVTRCTYKTRIIRGGPKKMRHHFAKEHFSEL